MRVPGIAVLAAAAMLAGCGTDEDDAAGVTRGFFEAIAAADAPAACAALSDSTREKLEKDEKAPCAEALGKLGLSGDSELVGTYVSGTSATASLEGGERAFLDRTPDGWRISAAGCMPAGAKEPYDCELES